MLSRGGDHGNEFPNGSCKGQAVKERSRGRSYCGWVSSVHKRVYIMPGAFLPRVNFTDVRLRNAILTGAYLEGCGPEGCGLEGCEPVSCGPE